ncbi:16S rRNA (cytidine(1402)-2'-O)-methyltransferase [Candidatus Falkowbacteria bacterium]|nr:16S rRNA (cytidine(1402)-2'-O)-methyltransferase [Candidatus Falkowbacteria bacterium]
MSTLYIVATPIGNLQDVTLRALETLKGVDLILCEDTRQTKKLLERYQITVPTMSYHQYSKMQKIEEILIRLADGKNLALVSDAGTPGIADPGNYLVKKVAEHFGQEVQIVPIPGPAALTTLAAVSGLPTDQFLFLGFLPHKKGRQTLIKEIISSERAIILYESTHRIHKLLNELVSFGLGERQLVLGRELTKQFETIYRGSAAEILQQLEATSSKGEFTVVVQGRK